MDPETGGSTRHHCPIDACTWHHDAPSDEFTQIVSDTGPDGSPDLESLRRNRSVAAARLKAHITAHCETHSTAEWAAEVSRLRLAVTLAEDRAAAGGDHVRRAPDRPR